MGLTIPAAALYHNLWYEIATCLFLSSESGLVQDIIITKLSPQSDIGTFTITPKDIKLYRTAIASSIDTWLAQNSDE